MDVIIKKRGYPSRGGKLHAREGVYTIPAMKTSKYNPPQPLPVEMPCRQEGTQSHLGLFKLGEGGGRM